MSDCDDSAETSRKRPAPSPSPTGSVRSSKRNKSTANNRGLRHFSMMVCKKVEEKGTTTYNEVADELVRCVVESRDAGKFDEKNIRRRVYDALNVLMAMDIISKDKKEITWKGLPNFSKHRDLESLRQEVQQRQEQIKQKQETLRELLVQQVCFRNLVMHNARKGHSEEKIPIPFIVVNTHSSSVIQCDMSRDRTNVMFDFSMPFEINDDNTILKKMNMDKTTISELRSMVPEDMMRYFQEHGMMNAVLDRSRQRSPELHHPPHVHSSRRYHPDSMPRDYYEPLNR